MFSLESRYNTNESLLQSYRSIFISSESFLLAVGAMLYENSANAFYVVSILSILKIYFIWIPVVKSRQKVVDYFKFCSNLSEKEMNKICTLDEYVHNSELRKETNKIFKIKSNWRPTRIKIDGVIPATFAIIWLVLTIFQILETNI